MPTEPSDLRRWASRFPIATLRQLVASCECPTSKRVLQDVLMMREG